MRCATPSRPDPAAFHVGTLGLVLEPMAAAIAAAMPAVPAGTLVMLDPNCRPGVIADRAAYLDRLGRVVARSRRRQGQRRRPRLPRPGAPRRSLPPVRLLDAGRRSSS